ncbi:homeodomain-like protein [Vibrio phage 1.293.O._10N.261.52.E1]|nr:homeodomain-like protein [Vibrio phage 1.293.O._10N.261.52.E1]
MNKRDRRALLERCVDTKTQKAVSLDRLAKELGITPMTKEEKIAIVEERKVRG